MKYKENTQTGLFFFQWDEFTDHMFECYVNGKLLSILNSVLILSWTMLLVALYYSNINENKHEQSKQTITHSIQKATC